MDKQKILEKLQKDRNKKADDRVPVMLRAMVEKDLAVLDTAYIERRLMQILEETIYKADFSDPELEELRRKLLKRQLELVLKGLPKPKEFKKKTKDLTEIRDSKAEPVVYEILYMLLDGDLLFSDDSYISAALTEQSVDMFKLLSVGYSSHLFNRLEFHLAESMRRANLSLWGGKTREQVSFRDVDKVLKSEKQIPIEGK